MKVLLLHRQPRGGLARHVHYLQRGLADLGIEAQIEEASAWIPNETGGRVDRQVALRLRALGKDFDIVHAFGYRAAWACAETYGHREAWIYTAYDMPKTTHRILIDKLNQAQLGICSSNAVLMVLDRALALDLSVISPGVPPPPDTAPSRLEARAAYHFPEDAALIGGMGRFIRENCFHALLEAFFTVAERRPDALLTLAGSGPEEEALRSAAERSPHASRVRILPWQEDPGPLMCALDLLVVPSARAGFSMAAVEAMNLSVPVMLRNKGGLYEIVEPHISGFLFDLDESLAAGIEEVLDMPITLESVGKAGRLRVMERFSLEQCAEGVAGMYRSVLQEVDS